MTTTQPTMTRAERNDLAKLVRQRARVANAQVVQRKAELLADFERQLGSIYTPDDDATFKLLHATADTAAKEARSKLAKRCRELRIPKAFAPDLRLEWYDRGENALAERRAELRKMAVSRLDAMAKGAKTEIERASVEVQTQLIADGLTSEAAQRFLAEMPSVQSLMPRLSANQIKGLLRDGGQDKDGVLELVE